MLGQVPGTKQPPVLCWADHHQSSQERNSRMQEMMGRRGISAINHILRGTAGDKTVLASGKLQTMQNG